MRCAVCFIATTLALLITVGAHGEDPPLYLLRIAPGWRQGIVRFDPETRTERPFASFIYAAYFGGADGGLQLAALPGRIIAQGAAYYEFDAGSGQFLRRYPALAPGYDGWAFHGVAVDRSAAQLLGISPGYYGSPICPPSGSADPPILCSVPAPFPGYSSRTTLPEQNVLLRRGLEPGDTALSVAKIFSADSAGGSPWSMRFPAVDVSRHQFWFWLEGSVDGGSGYLQRVTAVPIASGTIGDEILTREDHTRFNDPPERWRSADGFAYDSSREAFFLPFSLRENLGRRLVRQSIEGLEETLSQAPESQSFDSVTFADSSDDDVYTQLLPAVADTAGANGTRWRSDGWLFNPSNAPIEVTLRRVSRPEIVKHFSLEAGASRKVTNVLGELGGGPTGDGAATDAVIVESPYRSRAQLSVYSRTYTSSSGGGTYGQAIPAVPTLVGYSNHIAPTTLARSIADTQPVFLLDRRDPGQYRHNVGMVNTSDGPLTIRLRYGVVSLLPANGADYEKVLTVPPHSVRQYTIEALFPQDVLEHYPPFVYVAGDRPAALWLSMVDNKTGDASFIPFTYYGIEAAPDARLAFPAIAHTRGANGTFWRTDGYGVFWVNATGGQPQAPEVNFYSTTPQCASESMTRRLTPTAAMPGGDGWLQFWKSAFVDIARQVCPSSEDAAGALEVRTGSWMTMVSRTYTTREDGGTYGDILPLYPPRGWPERHFAGVEMSEAFRVNIGLYNGSDLPSKIIARLFDANGALVAEKTIALEPRASLQSSIRQFFGGQLKNGLYGLSFVSLEGAGCWPYVSTVDNITGDPTNWW